MLNDKPAILAVDDCSVSLTLLVNLLSPLGYQVRTADSGELALAAVAANPPDLILLDVRMPGIDGLEVCRRLKARPESRHIPVILISAFAEVKEWVAGLQLGAADYITKPFQAEELLARVQTHLALQCAHVSLAQQAAALQAHVAEIERMNRLYATLSQANQTIARCKSLAELFPNLCRVAVEFGQFKMAWIGLRIAGRDRVSAFARYAAPQDAPLALPCQDCQDCGCSITVEAVRTGRPCLSNDLQHDERTACCHAVLFQLGVRSCAAFPFHLHGEACGTFALCSAEADFFNAAEVYLLEEVCLDISYAMENIKREEQRQQAEADREKLQAQLIQSQKMEAVGRLAGGVAHDFNNMLSVILGQTEMALINMEPSGPLFSRLMEIHKAAERSANLTRQLLAFARKQTIAPKVLDLNETLEGMLKMLRRLIGEDIVLAWLPADGLWPVKVDPSQIDQILANLCVNARDAISGVGKVTIETRNVVLDEAYCAEHVECVPGDYVLLAVDDNGCGMDKETLGKLFEPFFTTKEMGKGTGLGLATVYGIVKQNKGFINVYSEPGQGATFKIYLPRHLSEVERVQDEAPTALVRGHETILLVEDEPSLLEMTQAMLESLGYTVQAAATPSAAMHMAKEHASHIRLLISDVVMPEKNGRELAKDLTVLNPSLECLFMSGYTANAIAHHGVLDEGVHFIPKPFSLKTLAAKVREVLDYGKQQRPS
jgi:signal transduction histidine kinase/DNA-binding response OmpR family regulator